MINNINKANPIALTFYINIMVSKHESEQTF